MMSLHFLTEVSSYIGDSSKYLHYGLTSSDVGDTALSLQMVDASDIILEKVKKLLGVLIEQAKKYAHTVMVGRTHGIHAEPVTLGLKMAVWAFEMNRNLERLKSAKDTISYGKISGAVGTYANTSPQVEEKVCALLGLKAFTGIDPDTAEGQACRNVLRNSDLRRHTGKDSP